MSQDFNVMGMNIGSSYIDYSNLVDKPQITDSLDQLMDKYKTAEQNYNVVTYREALKAHREADETYINAGKPEGLKPGLAEKKAALDEQQANRDKVHELRGQILNFLDTDQKWGNEGLSKDQRDVLAKFIFEEGLDVLENRLDIPGVKELIEENEYTFIDEFNKHTQDYLGAKHMLDNYPKLCAKYLNPTIKYNDLPENTPYFRQHVEDIDELRKGTFEEDSSATFINYVFHEELASLEEHLDKPNYQKFIRENHTVLLDILKSKITDKKSAEQMRNDYPNLCNFLSRNYNRKLPKDLKMGWFAKIRKNISNLMKVNKPKSKEISLVDKKFQNLKDRLAVNFFERVLESPEKPAVLLLQEVQSSNQNVLKLLTQSNYQIIQLNGGVDEMDCAIALDSSRFEPEEGPPYPLEAAGFIGGIAVCALDKTSGEAFIFISTHLPGYALEISQDPDTASYDQIFAQKKLETSKEMLETNMQDAIANIRTRHPNAKVIMQGDFNTNPEYFDQNGVTEAVKALNPFTMLQRQNLDLIRTTQTTAKKADSETLPERELDFVVTSPELKDRVTIMKSENAELTGVTKIKKGGEDVHHFDPMLLASDHRPLWMKVKQQPQEPPP